MHPTAQDPLQKKHTLGHNLIVVVFVKLDLFPDSNAYSNVPNNLSVLVIAAHHLALSPLTMRTGGVSDRRFRQLLFTLERGCTCTYTHSTHLVIESEIMKLYFTQ